MTDIRPGHVDCYRCRHCDKPWCPDCSTSGAICDCSPENSPGWVEVSPGHWKRGSKPWVGEPPPLEPFRFGRPSD